MTTISTHVLDQAHGGAAAGMGVRLEHVGPEGLTACATGETDADGRLKDLLPAGAPQTGTFRLTFAAGPWWSSRGVASLHPEIVVVFAVDRPGQHWHIPVLMGPFGYTTYRGT